MKTYIKFKNGTSIEYNDVYPFCDQARITIFDIDDNLLDIFDLYLIKEITIKLP